MLRLARALAPLIALALPVVPATAQETPDGRRTLIEQLALASGELEQARSIEKLEALVFDAGEDSAIARRAFVALGDLHGARGEWETAAAYYRATAVALLAEEHVDVEEVIEEEEIAEEPEPIEEDVFEDSPAEEPLLQKDMVAAAGKRIHAYEQLAPDDRTEEHVAAYLADLKEYADGLAAIERGGDPGDRAYFRDAALHAYERLVFAAGDGTLPALAAYVGIGDLHAEVGDFETAAAFYQSSAVMLLDSTERTVNERVQRKLERQSKRSKRRDRDDR